jgi:hypothetical protein
MTCQEVNEYLDRTSPADVSGLPEVVRKHLDNCECCQRLWGLLSRRPCPRQVPELVRSRIEQDVLGSLEPVKPLPEPGKLTLAFALVFAGFSALFAALMASSNAPGVSTGSFAAFGGIIGVIALWLSVTLSREMVPGEIWRLSRIATHAVAVVGLFGAAALVFPWRIDEPFAQEAWKCYKAGFVLALPAAVLAVWLLRRGVLFSPRFACAGAGFLGGLVGIFSLHFSCPTIGAAHITMGHLMVPVTGAVIGFAGGHLASARGSAENMPGPAVSS